MIILRLCQIVKIRQHWEKSVNEVMCVCVCLSCFNYPTSTNCFFSYDLNDDNVSAHMIVCDSLFHRAGPASSLQLKRLEV